MAHNARNPRLFVLPPHLTRGVVREKVKMSISRILNGLETIDATGHEAVQAARLGILEWAFCAQDGGTSQAALKALDCHAARNARSDAARAFVEFLKDATVPCVRPTRRRVRILH